MGHRSPEQVGRDHRTNDKYDPPENLIGETISRDVNDHFHRQREEYRKGWHDRDNEIKHGKK